MGCILSCFGATDHPLDTTTQNANNANVANRNNNPNLYNKNSTGNEVVPPGNIQCETGVELAIATEKEIGKETDKLIEKDIGGCRYLYPSVDLEDEEECPTCLEVYTPENPKITTKCCHNFHLACIYEWTERKQTCPICNRVMAFEDLSDNTTATEENTTNVPI